MQHALDSVLHEFKNDVERVENLLNLTKIFRDFGASTPPQSPVDDADEVESPNPEPWVQAISLHKESKDRRTDLPIFSGSLLLYLVGRFEYCIRQIVETIADDVVGKTDKYQNLPDPIRKVLKQRTLEIAQNPKKFGHDEISSETLLASLVGNIRDSEANLTIKSEVLSITEANMRPGVLHDILKTVGITDFWKEVGKQANVKIALGKSVDQEAATEAKTKLNDVMEERNQIAHPTTSTQFPDADGVLKRAEFLKIIASNAVDLAKVYLASYEPIGAPQQ